MTYRRAEHACLLRPVPPNLRISRQGWQVPQSGVWHDSQTPQRFRRGPSLSDLCLSSLSICPMKKFSNTSRTKLVVVALLNSGAFFFTVCNISNVFRHSIITQKCKRGICTLLLIFLIFVGFLKLTPAIFINARIHGVVINKSSLSIAVVSKLAT